MNGNTVQGLGSTHSAAAFVLIKCSGGCDKSCVAEITFFLNSHNYNWLEISHPDWGAREPVCSVQKGWIITVITRSSNNSPTFQVPVTC